MTRRLTWEKLLCEERDRESGSDTPTDYHNAFDKDYSPWKKFQSQMCMKTVAKECLKFMPLSIELREAISSDYQVKPEFSPEESNVFDIPYEEIIEEEIVNEKVSEKPEPKENIDNLKINPDLPTE